MCADGMKRPTLLVSVIAGLALAMSGGVFIYLWEARFAPEARVMERVRSSLIDPESARFEDVRAYPALNSGCGFVNAKNRMGGYTGRRQFVALPDGSIAFAPAGDDGIGSLNDRISRQQKLVEFLQLAVRSCPERGRSQ